MSTTAAPTANGVSTRRTWWAELPVLFCLRCHERDAAGKLDDVSLVLYHGNLRCRRCHTVHYALVLAPLHVAFVAETTAHELKDIERRQLTVLEILDHFGQRVLPRRDRAA